MCSGLVINGSPLQEEKERSCMFADELAKMEVKLKEQLKTNESLKLQLAAEEDRYKVGTSHQLYAAFKGHLSLDSAYYLSVWL